MFIKQTLLHGLIIITSMMYTDILVVHAKIKRKKFFFDFTLTPSHIPWEVPVYRYFKCEGKCEGW